MVDGLPSHTILLHHIVPSLNSYRFYRFTICVDLFGVACLIRNWGRIGTFGRFTCESYSSLQLAEKALISGVRDKIARGYQIDIYKEGYPKATRKQIAIG